MVREFVWYVMVIGWVLVLLWFRLLSWVLVIPPECSLSRLPSYVSVWCGDSSRIGSWVWRCGHSSSFGSFRLVPVSCLDVRYGIGIGLVCDSVGSRYRRRMEWKSFSWCCYGRRMGRYSYGYGTVGLGYWMGR